MKQLKHILSIIILSALSVSMLSACSASKPDESTQDNNLTVMTSFYPMYVIAENVIGDADGISLENMAPPQTGCLHDYQLSTTDMKKLDKADIFIINGGGMESFLDNALALYPDLSIIDTSIGTIEIDEHDEGNLDEHEHDHEENSHFWIYPENAAIQAQNICNALCEAMPENSEAFKNNTKAFIDSLSSIPSFDGSGIKACVFNEAFEYFELSYNMDIPYCVELDENQSPSAKELAEIINSVNEDNIQLLITADDAGELIADTIARETNAKVIRLDPVLTGDYSADSYVKAMINNTNILENAINGGLK